MAYGRVAIGVHGAGGNAVPAEAGSGPSHEGIGSNNCDGLEDCRKPPIQMDEEQTITIREPDMSAHLPHRNMT